MVVDFNRLFDTILEHDKRIAALKREQMGGGPKTIFSFTEKDKEKMFWAITPETREILSAWLKGEEEDSQKYPYRGERWTIAANYFLGHIREKIRETASANKG